MKVIDINKWGKFIGCEVLCFLLLLVNEFSQCIGIELEEFVEDGLGVCYCVFIQIWYFKYFVQGFVSRDSKSLSLLIDMEGN